MKLNLMYVIVAAGLAASAVVLNTVTDQLGIAQDNGGGASPMYGAPGTSGSFRTAVSSDVNQHIHSIAIRTQDINTYVAALANDNDAISIESSSGENNGIGSGQVHSHTVLITKAQLVQLRDTGVLAVESMPPLNHTHIFTFFNLQNCAVMATPAPTIIISPPTVVVPLGGPSGTPSNAPPVNPSGGPTVIPSGTPSVGVSSSPSPSPSPSRSVSPSPSPSPSRSVSPSPSPSPSPSRSVSPSPSPSPSKSVSPSPSPSPSRSVSPSPSPSPSPSRSVGSSPSPSPSPSRSVSPSPSPSPSRSASPSPSPSPSPRVSTQPSGSPSKIPSSTPSEGPSATPAPTVTESEPLPTVTMVPIPTLTPLSQ